MLSIMSDKKFYGGKKDWAKLANTLITNYDEESIVFIISDFIDTNPEEFVPNLASYFSKVYGIMIRDPIDDILPHGVGRMYIKDIDSISTYLPNLEKLREEYRILNLKNVEKMRETFHKYDQLFFKIQTDEDFGTGFIKALGAEEVIID
jgi:hypothetical protein